MSDEWIKTVSNRYIELYEKVIGEKFIPEPLSDEEITARVEKSLERVGLQPAP
jgi:phosphoribosylaminoimidazole-succinocarboxamide synthase